MALMDRSFSQSFLDRGGVVGPFDHALPIHEAYSLVLCDEPDGLDEIEAFRV